MKPKTLNSPWIELLAPWKLTHISSTKTLGQFMIIYHINPFLLNMLLTVINRICIPFLLNMLLTEVINRICISVCVSVPTMLGLGYTNSVSPIPIYLEPNPQISYTSSYLLLLSLSTSSLTYHFPLVGHQPLLSNFSLLALLPAYVGHAQTLSNGFF